MLINLKQALQFAVQKNIAVGSFNIYNVESLQAVLRGTAGTDVPVICSFGESYDRHMPLEAMAELVKFYAAKSRQAFVLHLDHSRQEKTVGRALKAGFTSIMYDGSAEPLAENIRRTRAAAALAHSVSASVEGELGYMNEEDGSGFDEKRMTRGYTTVSAAADYAQNSGADALAIAIGNAHGIYRGTPSLDLDRLQEIHKAVQIPLVLHGSSGIPRDLLQKAIRSGIRKININTEISTTGINASREFLLEHTDKNTRFETMTKFAEDKMSEVVKEYSAWFTFSKT